MPATTQAKHPKGYIINFFEDTHKYTSEINGEQIQYVSGTTFLHKFFPPFDVDGSIAKRCAERDGITIEEVRAKWAAAGKEATTLGTRVHECCEDIILNRDLRNTPSNPKEECMMKHAIEIARKFKDRLDIIGVEKIVFSPSLKIAGTIDLLGRSKKDGTYIIIDHKTNKSIDIENTWNKFALDPISHLDDTNYVHYGCQLNLYEYLLKREGYVPKNAKFKKFLNHITVDKANMIEIFDLQHEIKDMIIQYLLTI
jgi:ATP-dependent exoDNAse (exonuclease V) beta subunit